MVCKFGEDGREMFTFIGFGIVWVEVEIVMSTGKFGEFDLVPVGFSLYFGCLWWLLIRFSVMLSELGQGGDCWICDQVDNKPKYLSANKIE